MFPSLCSLNITDYIKNFPLSLRSFASQSSRQLDVLLLDGDSLGVDGAQVSVFKQRHQVGFDGFLQGTNGRRLESQVGLEVLGDFSDQSLERQLSDQKLGRLLESSDFSQGDGTGLVSVGLLDTTGGGGRLSRGLRRQLLSGGLTTSRLSCGLLSSSHCECVWLVACSSGGVGYYIPDLPPTPRRSLPARAATAKAAKLTRGC